MEGNDSCKRWIRLGNRTCFRRGERWYGAMVWNVWARSSYGHDTNQLTIPINFDLFIILLMSMPHHLAEFILSEIVKYFFFLSHFWWKNKYLLMIFIYLNSSLTVATSIRFIHLPLVAKITDSWQWEFSFSDTHKDLPTFGRGVRTPSRGGRAE